LIENDFSSFFTWHDTQSWHPFGRDVALTTPPGLPFSGALLFLFLNSIGFQVSLMDVCIFFPPILGAVTCITIYYLAKYVSGEEAGLFAALFLALNPAHISRTYLGFYKHETIGVFSILLVSFFYLRSIEEENSNVRRFCYAIAAGSSLGFLCISWGAFYYMLGLVAALTAILFLLKRYNFGILVSYFITMILGLGVAVQIPRPGLSMFRSIGTVPVFVVFILLVAYEASLRLKSQKSKNISISIAVISTLIGFYGLYHFGYISPLVGRLISVLNPFARIDMPIVQSVAEHRPATWAAFYYEFGLLSFLSPLGFYFTVRRNTNANIFLTLFGITSLYFAASMVRLTLIMAPAFCMLGGLVSSEILKPFADIARGTTFFSRRKTRFVPRVGSEFGILAFILLLIIVFPTLWRGVDSAYQPVTIATSSIPARQNYGDWLEALTWMSDNLGDNAVVASWWDYGYWITDVANTTTIVDNSTVNTTQIAQVALMFLSNETQALPILQRLGATHVVVFSTISLAQRARQPIYFGDEVKWSWMAEIAGLDRSEIEDPSPRFTNIPMPKPDLVLSTLIYYGIYREYVAWGGIPVPEYFDLAYASSSDLVFIYQINYE
jgi:dolichyl-diphosphooligosaccharide--protein glycosyltransferase